MTSKKVLVYATLATGAACATNAALYLVGRFAGAEFVVPHGPNQELGPLGLDGIPGVTAGSMLLGTGALLVLDKLAPRRARAIWYALALLLVGLSFLPFVGSFATSTKLWLAPMHLTTPAALVAALQKARNAQP